MLNRSQAPTRRMFVDPKGFGKSSVFSDRVRISMCTRTSRTTCLGCSRMFVDLLTFNVFTAATVLVHVSEFGVEMSVEMDDSSSSCCQSSPKKKVSMLSCQQKMIMTSRVDVSCM